jgi:prephenate dehydrogenase
MPYLAAVALTHLVAEADERELLMLLAAGGFRDLTRVASGSPRMSRDMVVANRAAVREAVARFGRALTALAERLDDPDALLEAAEGPSARATPCRWCAAASCPPASRS